MMKTQHAIRIHPAVFVYVLAFVSPFAIYGIGIGEVGFTPINFLSILFFPAFLMFFLFKNWSLKNLTLVGVLHLAYFVFAFLASAFATKHMAAVRGSVGYLIDFFLCYLFAVYFIQEEKQIRTVLKIFIFVGAVNAVMGLVQFGGFFFFGEMIAPPFVHFFHEEVSTKNFGYGTGLFSIAGFMKMYGFLGAGSDAFGGYTLISLAFSMYFFQRKKNFFYAFLIVFFGITLLLSCARNAYVGTLFFFLFLYFFYRPLKEKIFQRIFKVFSLVFIVIFLVGGGYITQNMKAFESAEIQVSATSAYKTPIFLLQRVNPFASASFQISLVDFFWGHLKYALVHGFDNFGLGMGLQNFDDYVSAIYVVKYGSHSDFILTLGGSGYIGLLIQMLIIFCTIRYGLKAYYQQPRENIDSLPLFLTALFVGMVAIGIVRTFYFVPYNFLIIGLIVRLYTIKANEYREAGAIQSYNKKKNGK